MYFVTTALWWLAGGAPASYVKGLWIEFRCGSYRWIFERSIPKQNHNIVSRYSTRYFVVLIVFIQNEINH